MELVGGEGGAEVRPEFDVFTAVEVWPGEAGGERALEIL